MTDELSATEMLESVSTETASATPAAAPAQQQGPWWSEKIKEPIEYTIEGGRNISEPLEMVLKRAGMGYNYAQRMHQINQQQERFKQIEEKNKALSRWEEYDNYAKTNPDWAKHVEESWNNRQNLQQLNQGQPQQLPPEVTQKLQAFEQFMSEMQQREQKMKFASEDKQLAEEITGVGKKFGVDLTQADEQGRTLEWRVLEHMQKLGLDGSRTGHFTAAFKDYHFDSLQGLQKERAIEEHAKSQAELKKAGIRAITRTPKQQGDFNGYRPGMSDRELTDLALAELRAAKSS